MKIAIVTITNSSLNYGNRLQNLALKYILEENGFEVETLLNTKGCIIYKIQYYFKQMIKFMIGRGCRQWLRQLEFKKFEKQYLNYTKPIKHNHLDKLVSKYDYFVVGSDQVWNFRFPCNEICKKYLLLDFVDKNRKIAFAASFGTDCIQDEDKEIFIQNLNNYKAISVREDTGANIIEGLIHKKVPVLVDPTMLLTKEEWKKVAVKPRVLPENYIVTYFLGEVDEEQKKYIKNLSDTTKMEVVDLVDEWNIYGTKLEYYKVRPDEFVYIITNAKLVLTDSFHGTVFSIISEIPMVVFERNKIFNISSRIDTLLKKFDLENRRYPVNNIWNINFNKKRVILKKEREKAIQYINKFLL